jgi:hypothetical protein
MVNEEKTSPKERTTEGIQVRVHAALRKSRFESPCSPKMTGWEVGE